MKKLYAIGIDIGGTAIKHGICSSEGILIQHDSIPTPADAPKAIILQKIFEVISQNLALSQEQGMPISAVGVGTPGSVDIERGYLMGSTPNFKHWRNVAIAESIKHRFDLPVFADNDANLMAFGEFSFGAGKEKKDVICLTLGTGIGGGIIIDGEIYRGSFYAGSELGHMSIDYKGRQCNCGGQGCLERYASATALIQDYNLENPKNPVSGTKQIFLLAKAKDKIAQKVIKNFVSYLAAGIANVVNIFNPEMIIIGGGVSKAGAVFIEDIRDACQKRAMPVSFKNVEIVGATLGNDAGMMGATAFALKSLGKKGVVTS
ncbi:MAG: ROK family protein [bacterium]|nr:MAG: ROK family protein [bacterium]